MPSALEETTGALPENPSAIGAPPLIFIRMLRAIVCPGRGDTQKRKSPGQGT